MLTLYINMHLKVSLRLRGVFKMKTIISFVFVYFFLMTLYYMFFFSSDSPDPDECLKYHVKDKEPMFSNCEEKQGVQCINGK